MTERTLRDRLRAAWRAFNAAPEKGAPPAAVNPCSFDAAMTRMLRRPLEINSIISIGAGRGTDGETFLRYWPNATLLLVEMDSRFEPEFKAMAARNPNVRYEICGAAGEDNVGLQLKSDKFGGAVVPAGATVAGDATEVRLQRIDTLAKKHGLKPPYFLQFDTHGAESDILTGAEEVLAGTALIMMEVYNFKFRFMDFKNLTFDEMTTHLKSRGFRAADFCNPLFRPHDQVLWQLQMFFRRADEKMFAHTSYAPPKGET
jgi:FkbM family methyltransferase